MKKMKILSVLLATIIASTSFVGCTNSNNTPETTNTTANQAKYPGSPSPENSTTDNAEVLPNYNPTKEDLDLNTRIFTEMGFSVATQQTTDSFNLIFSVGHSTPISLEPVIKNELTKLLDKDYFQQVINQSIDVTKPISSKIIAQFLMIQLNILSTSNPDVLAVEDIEQFIEDNLEITQETSEIFGGNQHIINGDVDYFTSCYEIHKVTVKMNDGGNDIIAQYFPNSYEIYNIPYKPNPSSGKRFEVVYLQVNDETTPEQRLEEIQFMADTFILDQDAIELNQDGKSKFASVCFTVYANQDYFPNTTLIPYSRTSPFEDFDIIDNLDLNFTDENLSNTTQLSVAFADYVMVENLDEYVSTEINSNTFDILTQAVDVKAEDGTITQEDLIVSIIHSSPDLGDFKTYIQLTPKDLENNNFSISECNQADFDMINEIFNDIMDNYQVKLNNSCQTYMEMINGMNEAFETIS